MGVPIGPFRKSMARLPHGFPMVKTRGSAHGAPLGMRPMDGSMGIYF